ncbi:MAG: hypothetical protein ISR69_04555 [Gammaproteobacteria bacterium]|nr:hypothetical protein [Gammaproteobacteria bacterium]
MTNKESPFFLTKSSANLAQKLQYHFDHVHIPIVLWGETGVGKTSFFHFFMRIRFAQRNVVWINTYSSKELHKSCKKIDKNDQDSICIVDQLERCSAEEFDYLLDYLALAKCQLVFISKQRYQPMWTVHGNRLSSKVIQFKYEPMLYPEALAYFTEKVEQHTAMVNPQLPFMLRHKIKQCKGSVVQLNSLFEHNQDNLSEFKQKVSREKWLPSFLLAIILCLIVFYLFITPQDNNKLLAHFVDGNDSAELVADHKPLVINKLAAPKEKLIAQEATLKPVALENPKIIHETAPVDLEVSEMVIESTKEKVSVDEIIQVEVKAIKKHADKLPDIIQKVEHVFEKKDAQIKNVIVDEKQPIAVVETLDKEQNQSIKVASKTLLDQVLFQTKQWLSTAKDNQWTQQILVFSESENANQQFASFYKSLEKRQINTDVLMVYEFGKKSNRLYSIVYGQYDNKITARKGAEKIAKKLTNENVILRTVQGIRAEIN